MVVAMQERDLNSDDDQPSLNLRSTSFADDDEVTYYHANTLYSATGLTDVDENVVEVRQPPPQMRRPRRGEAR